MIVLTKGYKSKEYADYAVKANNEGKILTILSNGDVDLSDHPSFTLDEVKKIKIEKMKLIKNNLENSGFTYMNKQFDSDSISVQKISIAGLQASNALRLNKSFSIEWTCKDNTVLSLNGSQMLELSDALATYFGSLHEKYRQIKNLINSKETIKDVNNIDWETFIMS